MEVRFDDIREVGLYPTIARKRAGIVRQDAVQEFSVIAYGEVAIASTDSLRTSLGFRVDHFDWDVLALREANSGKGNVTVISPKLQFAYRLAEAAEVYANYGRGFHSDDVRGAALALNPQSGDCSGRSSKSMAGRCPGRT